MINVLRMPNEKYIYLYKEKTIQLKQICLETKMFFLGMYVLQRVTNDVCIPKSHDLIIFICLDFFICFILCFSFNLFICMVKEPDKKL